MSESSHGRCCVNKMVDRAVGPSRTASVAEDHNKDEAMSESDSDYSQFTLSSDEEDNMIQQSRRRSPTFQRYWDAKNRVQPLDLAAFENSVHPPHIIDAKGYMLAKERAMVEGLYRGSSYRAKRRVEQEAQRMTGRRWKVQSKDYNAWRRRTLDNQPGSIYTMQEDCLKDPSLDLSISLPSTTRGNSSRSTSKEQGTPGNHPHIVTIGSFPVASSEQSLEKQYIVQQQRNQESAQHGPGIPQNRKSGSSTENIRFTLHIMKRYNKPAHHSHHSGRDFASYGAPAPGDGASKALLAPEKSMMSKIVDGVVHPPPSITLRHAHVRPMHFNAPTASDFCEVLGPTSCRDCIEGTNRYTAYKVENLFFPEIGPYPGTSLVVQPKPGGHIAARESRREALKAELRQQQIGENDNHHDDDISNKDKTTHDPDQRSKTRERSVTLAIKKNSTKMQSRNNNHNNGRTADNKGIILPVISQGMPTLASSGKKGKLKLKMYDRRWEARANDFFPRGAAGERMPKLDKEDSSLHLSEQQKRLRKMLENIKYKAAVNNPQTHQNPDSDRNCNNAYHGAKDFP